MLYSKYTVVEFRCDACGDIQAAHHIVDSEYRGCNCDSCHGTYAYHDTRGAEYVAIAAYYTHRVYGGPEEGGWYYTEGSRVNETLRCFPASAFPQAALYEEQLRAQYDTGYSEVRGCCERVCPAVFPSRRPHYS